MSATDKYSSPLADRYASQAMLELWSPRTRYTLWRQLWAALAEIQRELGVDIPREAIAQMREHVSDLDFDAVAAYERRFRHDVMAHVHAFADVAPLARPYIHLGATSAFVTDNTDLILMRRGLVLLRAKLTAAISRLAGFARANRALPCLGYTHLQPAQLTTVGKRACLWLLDLLMDVQEVDHRLATLPLRGAKGTTGTQASFLELFGGDHEKVRKLDALLSSRLEFAQSVPVSGQTYTRKIDSQVLAVVAGIAASAAKFSSDIRMLQAFGELEEPFEAEQVGSSAMAYKRNPMRSERIASLARFVISLEANPQHTHATQFLERTLDDSANRRLAIPEAFLATDAVLILVGNIASGLVVHERQIARRVNDELPFMATEAIIVAAVAAGRDRQAVHEVIRRHSMAALAEMRANGRSNDLLERLSGDSGLGLSHEAVHSLLDPLRFCGRAPEQVDEFLAGSVDPLLASTSALAETEELKV